MRLTSYQHFTITIIGLIFMLAGVLHLLFWNDIFKMLLSQLLALKPDSEIVNLWKAPPLNLTLDVYMFNWTNSYDFRHPQVNPKFQQVGPYRFIEQPTKEIVSWHPENASLTYRKRSMYFFDEAHSSGKLSDRVTILNALTIGAIFKSRYWQTMKRSVLGIALSMYGNDVTFKSTVDELTFKGFDDNRMNLANALPFTIPDLLIPFEKFGFFFPRNNSADYSGVFNIFTGTDDINKLGKLHSWNYNDQHEGYPKCGKIEGSPGEFQTPGLRENEGIQYFVTEFCRAVKLDYDKKVDVDGVTGFRYIGGVRSFDNGTLDKANACFCQHGKCLPTGVLNISACWFNLPLFISYPHFYKADPFYLQEVDGLQPEQDKHELSMTLEPETGLLLEMKGRLQLNMLVDQLEYSSVLRNARRRVFPLVWVDYRTKVSSADLARFKTLTQIKYYGRLLGLVWCAIGCVLLLFHPVKQRWNHRLIRHIEINSLTIGQHDAKLHKAEVPERSPLLASLRRSHKMLMKSLSRESDGKVDAVGDS